MRVEHEKKAIRISIRIEEKKLIIIKLKRAIREHNFYNISLLSTEVKIEALQCIS